MIKGLYTSASGMMLQMARQDIIANNIANVNTTGFKRDNSVASAFPEMLISRLERPDNAKHSLVDKTPTIIGTLGTGAIVSEVIIDHTQGSLQKTDNPTDLAIKDEGYFAIDTNQGERFTRNGSFKINEEGLLTTSQGYPVLDIYDDYIYIDGDFTVDNRGFVYINGDEITALKIVQFANNNLLQKQGDVLYTTEEPYTIMDNPNIIQGYTEGSNVNAVKEMVSLINVVRAYEANQKIVQAIDETLQTAIDKVGSTS